MKKKCRYPVELPRAICEMCRSRQDAWPAELGPAEVGSLFLREDGVVCFVPHSGMYGGTLDGEHVCCVCFTLYIDEDPWDRMNRLNAEQETKWRENAARERAERMGVGPTEIGRDGLQGTV
jgi:hypothetical protein